MFFPTSTNSSIGPAHPHGQRSFTRPGVSFHDNQARFSTVTLFSLDFLRCQSIHFNKSRTPPPDLSLESGHRITSLPFSEACTGFRIGYTIQYKLCVASCTRYTSGRSPAYQCRTWWQPPPIYPVARMTFVPPTVSDTKPQNWNSSLVNGLSRLAGPKAWNSLPSNLQEQMNTDTFKKTIENSSCLSSHYDEYDSVNAPTGHLTVSSDVKFLM